MEHHDYNQLNQMTQQLTLSQRLNCQVSHLFQKMVYLLNGPQLAQIALSQKIRGQTYNHYADKTKELLIKGMVFLFIAGLSFPKYLAQLMVLILICFGGISLLSFKTVVSAFEKAQCKWEQYSQEHRHSQMILKNIDHIRKIAEKKAPLMTSNYHLISKARQLDCDCRQGQIKIEQLFHDLLNKIWANAQRQNNSIVSELLCCKVGIIETEITRGGIDLYSKQQKRFSLFLETAKHSAFYPPIKYGQVIFVLQLLTQLYSRLDEVITLLKKGSNQLQNQVQKCIQHDNNSLTIHKLIRLQSVHQGSQDNKKELLMMMINNLKTEISNADFDSQKKSTQHQDFCFRAQKIMVLQAEPSAHQIHDQARNCIKTDQLSSTSVFEFDSVEVKKTDQPNSLFTSNSRKNFMLKLDGLLRIGRIQRQQKQMEEEQKVEVRQSTLNLQFIKCEHSYLTHPVQEYENSEKNIQQEEQDDIVIEELVISQQQRRDQ